MGINKPKHKLRTEPIRPQRCPICKKAVRKDPRKDHSFCPYHSQNYREFISRQKKKYQIIEKNRQ